MKAKLLTRTEKQDLYLNYFILSSCKPTVGNAINYLNLKHCLKGNILDKRI